MLMNCPECQLQVSDKAVACPHCGYPLKSGSAEPKISSKRRRLPNGFGQISRIKGQNLRKPYRAMITVGKTEFGRPICKPLQPNAYFKTYNEAYAALVEYNKSPYDLSENITFEELYKRWYERYSQNIAARNNSLAAAWKYCTPLYKMKLRSIRTRDLRNCIETATRNINGEVREASPTTKQRIKMLFDLMYDYAVEFELVDQNYARTISITHIVKEKNRNTRNHIALSEAEVEKLWALSDENIFAQMMIVQCYTGWRPDELVNIKRTDLDLENWTIVGGVKTDNGRNRIVPIHTRIRPIIERLNKLSQACGQEYLFVKLMQADRIGNIQYQIYRQAFTNFYKTGVFEQEHKPHDCRKTFVTLAKKYKVDEYAIKYIVGHSIQDLTERVYTEREISWLKEEIEKIR